MINFLKDILSTSLTGIERIKPVLDKLFMSRHPRPNFFDRCTLTPRKMKILHGKNIYKTFRGTLVCRVTPFARHYLQTYFFMNSK